MGAAVLLVAVAAVWAHRGPPRLMVVTQPVSAAALLLIGVAGGLSLRETGLSPGGAGFAVTAAGTFVIVYGVLLAVSAGRRALRDPRRRFPAGRALLVALVEVPAATVLFEEVAFRGVLWGFLAHAYGPVAATGGTALLFGAWHAIPAEGRRTPGSIAVAVLFTTAAGVVLGLLRQAGGGLIAPVAAHWAANGLGVLAAAAANAAYASRTSAAE